MLGIFYWNRHQCPQGWNIWKSIVLYLFATYRKIPKMRAIGDPFTCNQGKPILQARNVLGRAQWVFPAVQLCVPHCAFWTKLRSHYCALAIVHFGASYCVWFDTLALCLAWIHGWHWNVSNSTLYCSPTSGHNGHPANYYVIENFLKIDVLAYLKNWIYSQFVNYS